MNEQPGARSCTSQRFTVLSPIEYTMTHEGNNKNKDNSHAVIKYSLLEGYQPTQLEITNQAQLSAKRYSGPTTDFRNATRNLLGRFSGVRLQFSCIRTEHRKRSHSMARVWIEL
jgi:hypothetical protein